MSEPCESGDFPRGESNQNSTKRAKGIDHRKTLFPRLPLPRAVPDFLFEIFFSTTLPVAATCRNAAESKLD